MLSNEVVAYTSLERAIQFCLGSQIRSGAMDVLNEKYGISVKPGLVAVSYAQKALSEIFGSVGIMIVEKAIEYDNKDGSAASDCQF